MQTVADIQTSTWGMRLVTKDEIIEQSITLNDETEFNINTCVGNSWASINSLNGCIKIKIARGLREDVDVYFDKIPESVKTLNITSKTHGIIFHFYETPELQNTTLHHIKFRGFVKDVSQYDSLRAFSCHNKHVCVKNMENILARYYYTSLYKLDKFKNSPSNCAHTRSIIACECKKLAFAICEDREYLFTGQHEAIIKHLKHRLIPREFMIISAIKNGETMFTKREKLNAEKFAQKLFIQ